MNCKYCKKGKTEFLINTVKNFGMDSAGKSSMIIAKYQARVCLKCGKVNMLKNTDYEGDSKKFESYITEELTREIYIKKGKCRCGRTLVFRNRTLGKCLPLWLNLMILNQKVCWVCKSLPEDCGCEMIK